MQLYPYLLVAHRNCRQWGEQTCLAFAVKVVNEMEGPVVGNCRPLREVWEYEAQRERAYELLRAAGYETPGDGRS